MNTLLKAKLFSHVFVLTGLLAIGAGCNDDKEPTATLATAQFARSTFTFNENEGEQTISLTLDRPVLSSGQIVVKANAIVPSCYVTAPATQSGQIILPVEAGQTKVNFKMVPTDNQSLDGSKLVKFTISSVTPGMLVGTSRELLVSVNDDESPVLAAFEEFSLNVRENTTSPGKINIVFETPTPAEGAVVIKLQSTSGYGVAYATEPAAVSDKIFVQVPKGATSATVNIYPVNDQSFNADRNIGFRIINATGGIRVGLDNEFWCSITEDDGHQITTISSIREMYVGESDIIHGNIYIEGIVTSIGNTPGGRVVVEDATGALPLQFNTIHSLTRGDLVLVNLNYGLLHESNGLLEVIQVSEFEELGEETVRVNKIALEDLIRSGERMESQTVQISGVFTDADGTTKLRGDRVLTNDGKTIIVRTGELADFGDELVPDGLLNVTGIFTRLGEDLYVLYPQESKDIRKQQFMLIR